jgi:hypothetical protein
LTDHDLHFKQLLQSCFSDLVRIVAPKIAPKIRFESPTFLESELFTDVHEGEHRRLDLVARARSTQGDSGVILVHVEVEAQARSTMGQRLFDYAIQLWLRHHDPLLSVVIYLRGGEPGVTRQTFRIAVHGETIVRFRYYAFGLSGSQAADYVTRPEPLAWALAALMQPGRLTTAEHRLACLRPIAAAEMDDARKFLLTNFVDTYVQLDDSTREEYETLLADDQNQEVATMERTLLTNADRLVQKGYVEGLEEGKREGREQGQRELLLNLLTRRFGPLPETTRQRVQALTSSEELSQLAERVLDAPSLDDIGL